MADAEVVVDEDGIESLAYECSRVALVCRDWKPILYYNDRFGTYKELSISEEDNFHIKNYVDWIVEDAFVEGFSKSDSGVVVFRVRVVAQNKKTWLVLRRYSMFSQMLTFLESGNRDNFKPIWKNPFPGKVMFLMGTENLQFRSISLSRWLGEVISYAKGAAVVSMAEIEFNKKLQQELSGFLAVNSNVSLIDDFHSLAKKGTIFIFRHHGTHIHF